jgi:hypothetical protein
MMEPEEQEDEIRPLSEDEKVREFFLLGHLIKYNLFLSAQATVFAAIYSNIRSTRDAVIETRYVMSEFDRPFRTKKPNRTKKPKDKA